MDATCWVCCYPCWKGAGIQAAASLAPHIPLTRVSVFSDRQVLHLYCDTCSVPICRECTLGRHGGHNFLYLQDVVQDSRALTIQLLADAQQGRQAIQVSPAHPVLQSSGKLPCLP